MLKPIEIPIKGMTCASCAQAVQRALNRVEGVKNASVNLLTEKAIIEAENNINIHRLISIIRATGYDIGIEKLNLQIAELDAEIERLLENKLSKLDGVIEVKGDLVSKTLLIEFIPTIIEERKILSFIKAVGIRAKKYADSISIQEEKKREIEKLKRDFIVSLILTLPIILGSMFHFLFLKESYIQFLLATPVQFITGMRFHKLALIALRHGSANMNSLVSLGTNTAYFYSFALLIFGHNTSNLYFETSAVIITLILFGRTLEERAKTKTSEAIQKLIQMQPKKATVIRNNEEREINIDEVLIGDIVIIKQSEKIPVDGIIIEGSASIDESMFTGEPIPIDKSAGDKVIGGTILLSGVLKVEAKAVGKEALLNQIIKLIQEAQTGKPPAQRLADKISAIFVPSVLFVGILTFILWMLFEDNISMALNNSIAVLIIACPCALGLATPTAIMVATGRSAREGILVRNIEKLEEIGKIEILFLDKTGTLTQGKPEVKEVQFFEEDKKEILTLCATAEKYSEHPLAKAILRYCVKEGFSPQDPEKFEVIAGGGVFAIVPDSNGNKREVFIGSSKLMEKKNISLPEISYVEPATTVYMAVDNEIKAIFFITDPLREETPEIIEKLKKMGIEIFIISGDNERTVKNVAEKLGVEKYFASILPNEKAKIIRKFRVVEKKK